MMRPADKDHLQLYQLHAGKMVNILGVKKSNLLILHEGCLLSFVGHAGLKIRFMGRGYYIQGSYIIVGAT